MTMLKYKRDKSMLIKHKNTKMLIKHERIKIKENLKLLLSKKNNLRLFKLHKVHQQPLRFHFRLHILLLTLKLNIIHPKPLTLLSSIGELKAIKERNHAEALRKLMSSRGIDSVEKSPSSSTV